VDLTLLVVLPTSRQFTRLSRQQLTLQSSVMKLLIILILLLLLLLA